MQLVMLILQMKNKVKDIIPQKETKVCKKVLIFYLMWYMMYKKIGEDTICYIIWKKVSI